MARRADALAGFGPRHVVQTAEREMMAAADFENLLKASMGLNVASIGSSAIERAVQERLGACNLEDPHAYWERVRGSDDRTAGS